jgi:hypothetical protein
MDVVGGCPTSVKTDGFADDEGDCLGFGFADNLGGEDAP